MWTDAGLRSSVGALTFTAWATLRTLVSSIATVNHATD
jgi:hypothetical protein